MRRRHSSAVRALFWVVVLVVSVTAVPAGSALAAAGQSASAAGAQEAQSVGAVETPGDRSAGAAETSADQSIEVSVATTLGDRLSGGSGSYPDPYAVTEGQDLQVTVEWTGVPPGERIEVIDVDDNGDSTGIDVFSNFTVEDRTGSRTVVVDAERIERLAPNDTSIESFQRIELNARWINDGNTQLRGSGAVAVELISETTVYADETSLSVEPGESVSLPFYGWSNDSDVFVVLEKTDGEFLNVSSDVGSTRNSRFAGALRFTPSEYADDGETVTVQFRPQRSGPASNSVSVTVDEDQSVVDPYDDDGDGEITSDGLQRAIRDWSIGEISDDDLQVVIRVWASS